MVSGKIARSFGGGELTYNLFLGKFGLTSGKDCNHEGHAFAQPTKQNVAAKKLVNRTVSGKGSCRYLEAIARDGLYSGGGNTVALASA
jgi:hypothetical protein